MIRARLLALLLFLGVAPLLSFAGDPAPPVIPPPEYFFRHLPETNPYRSILEHYHRAPAEDRKALRELIDARPGGTPATPLTESQQKLARELTEALTRAASAPPTTSADWPMQPSEEEPDNLIASVLPEISSVTLLAKIATRTADALPASQAIETYAAVGQLARQQRNGLLVIQQFGGIRSENEAMAAASRRLGELDAAGLRALADSWQRLAPLTDPRRSLENERDRWLPFLLEAIVRPALLQWLGDDNSGPDSPATISFTRNLRLSGLIDLGGGEQLIGLENTATGEHFTLSAKRPAHDISLLRIDFDRREAIIRRGRREAVIHLESKKITERAFAPVKDPAREVDAWFAQNKKFQRDAWLKKVAAHPGGIDGYLDDLIAENERRFQAGFAAAGTPAATPSAPEPDDDPILEFARFPVETTLRRFNGSITQADMFQAAIQQRLAQLGETSAKPVTDPWSVGPSSDKQQPFLREPTPDGGFILRSRYEIVPGQPVAYKFGAPDSGVLRVSARK